MTNLRMQSKTLRMPCAIWNSAVRERSPGRAFVTFWQQNQDFLGSASFLAASTAIMSILDFNHDPHRRFLRTLAIL